MTRKTPRPLTEPDSPSTPPTAPRPRDTVGRELDQWGLPLAGPARARVLAEQGITDPALEPSIPDHVPDTDGIAAPAAPRAEPGAIEQTENDA